MELPFYGFNVILGMDWLIEHKAKIDFELKRVTLRSSEGWEAYLACLMGSQDVAKGVCEMRTVKDFPGVFPNELPRLPIDLKVEFTIELYPGSSPVSITPYRMAPKEIRELKIQLQELLDQDFIRPSISP
ncbi:uncharacterized protein [Gossypium hirsutum]|uniref:Uncharacterized protein n=1 Tax=Gossypium hirsutum TaxID=3635 RepID=A0A1U8IT89_GOSHI|nr:uncharacterized protein LOC107900087 [Gossypium hirsutum]